MYSHLFFLVSAFSRFSTHLPQLRFLSPMQPTTSSLLLINFSSPQHPTYTSAALHIPDVVPLPRHHERVHRHLLAQPRREASRRVRAASCGQCFWNTVHVLSPIKTKRRHSECSGARARLRSTGMHNTLAIRLTYSLYRSMSISIRTEATVTKSLSSPYNSICS